MTEALARNKSLVQSTRDFLMKSLAVQQASDERLETARVRQLIRFKFVNRRLPSQRPAVITGRPGQGGPCHAGERPLQWTQLVMEIPIGDSTDRVS